MIKIICGESWEISTKKCSYLLSCPEMYFLSNFNFYIAKTPCQYDKEEILMHLGSVSSPNFFRFRNEGCLLELQGKNSQKHKSLISDFRNCLR